MNPHARPASSARHRHRRHRRPLATAAALAILAVVAAACSSSEQAAPTTTIAATTTAATTTTVAATTTTAAPTTTVAATTTTIAPDPVMPLNGLPIVDQALANRPALVVKIDNVPVSRPQSGLNAADIVFEENVEGITRFAAVFHSADAEIVGPIRSGRTQDIALLGSLNSPLFAWSGGNGGVTRAVEESDLVNLSAQLRGPNAAYFRTNDRDAPHNLYSRTADLWAFTPVFAGPPPQQFQYRAPDEAFNGEPSSGAEVAMTGVDVTWTWDSSTSTYLREQGGRPHQDRELGQVNAANVVVLEVDYQPSPVDARSPEAQTIGTGTAYVWTAGVLVRGTWTRDDRLQPFRLTDASGAEILLTPGRTWVELAGVGDTTVLP